MITEQARSDVYINGQQAGQELEKLATRAEKLKKEMVEMRKANDKAGFDKKQKELRTVNKEMKDLQKQAFDVNKVLKNMKSTSLNDLYKAQRELNREMRKLPQGSKEFKKMEKDAQRLGAQINKVKANTRGVVSPLSKVKQLIGGIAVLAAFKNLVTNIIQVRSEFQKYEAVLTNALGSQQAANLAMKDLQNFAANTPFQLNELTDAYVKLTNQGFKPNIDQMTKLGDLAATQGKSFDQLTEAIIDAQTGEFERLKEFGIRASKQGDQVAFTFRGVESQVAFTANSIQDYILGLGEMEGVTGSMAGISATLGGRISNLRDSWTTLLNSMGENSTGIMVNVVNWMIDVVNTIDEATRRMRRFKMEYLEKNVADRAAQSILQIESLIRAGMQAGETYGEARLHAMNLFIATEQEYIDDKLRMANEARKEDNKELAEKYEYEALMMQKGFDVIKKHYEDEDKLKKKQAEDYKKQLAKQKENEAKEAEKENKKLVKAANDMQTEIYNAEMAVLHQKFIDKQLTEEEYEAEIMALKVANLLAEIEIRKQFNLDYADLEEELFSIRVAYIKKLEAEHERRDAKEKADAEKRAREEQQLRDKQLREYEKKINKTMDITSDLTNVMIDSWAQRKQSEADYNKAVEELRQDYTKGRMTQEEYEKALADLHSERRKEEVAEEKARGKQLLISILDYLRKYAHAKIAQITIGSLASAESIATFGIAGIAKAAILTAIVEAVLGGLKAKLSQNFAGRYPVTGAQDNRTYFATDSGNATTGIYTTPTLVAERGSEMIVDNPTLRNISINRPDILRDIQSLRVPQYASGRFPGGPAPGTASTSTSDIESVKLLRMIVSQNDKLLTDLNAGKIRSVVDDYQIRAIRDRTKTINDIEKRISK